MPYKADNAIDLSPAYLEIVRSILAKQLPQAKVRVFGSRVNGNAKPHSDLDLAIILPTQLDASQRAKLEEAFDESVLPIKIDIVEWHTLSPTFRKLIASNYVELNLVSEPLLKGSD